MNSKTSDLTLEELLELAGDISPADVIQKEANPEIKKFVRDIGIKDGSDRVPNFVVYHHYHKFWKAHHNKQSKIGFLRSFSKLFTQHRTNTVRYYKLNGELFDLTKEGIANARKWNKTVEKRRKTAKKTKRERKAEVSRAKEAIQLETS